MTPSDIRFVRFVHDPIIDDSPHSLIWSIPDVHYGAAIDAAMARYAPFVILEQDVAVGYEERQLLLDHIVVAPDVIWCVPYRVYYPGMMGLWAHAHRTTHGIYHGQFGDQTAELWTLGCTYIPARIWSVVYPTIHPSRRIFPHLARAVAEAAIAIGETGHLVPGIWATHLHWPVIKEAVSDE